MRKAFLLDDLRDLQAVPAEVGLAPLPQKLPSEHQSLSSKAQYSHL